ncbi:MULTISPECIES: O-methyltransferase [unclassified Duganella]|uniref:O-methyltransferase n=1 Tax=unclassified Duganella TaxID=2636909 RepID=UPI0006FBB3DA|nr:MULTISPECIES: class I SAM-dependent methyltransferase [unclassified Duganella]KQV43144.1 methyltransferase [Duganella sp. Root336D2]KRB97269.1 methyltransferase [Duganella sp. Root198D2]
MITLTSAPVAPLLNRLFDESENTRVPAIAAFGALPAEDRVRIMSSKTGYRDIYADLKDAAIPVSRETGLLLYMLARNAKANVIVEFGTSFGISTLHLAAALRDNGGGLLVTTEFEPSKVQRARENLEAGGLLDLVEIREGDALETLRNGLPEQIDLLLLDGAKGLYFDILRLVEHRLRPGALIIADNADYCPEYMSKVRDAEGDYLSLSLPGDVELSMKRS